MIYVANKLYRTKQQAVEMLKKLTDWTTGVQSLAEARDFFF
jgi:hypothetical protein